MSTQRAETVVHCSFHKMLENNLFKFGVTTPYQWLGGITPLLGLAFEKAFKLSDYAMYGSQLCAVNILNI